MNSKANLERLIHVVDNFHADPEKVRASALSHNYPRHSWRPRLCVWGESFPTTCDPSFPLRISKILSRSISYKEHFMGFFRVLTERKWLRLVESGILIHIDEYDWAGVIGLNPSSCGPLRFYRHKATRQFYIPCNAAWTFEMKRDAATFSRWDVIYEVDLKFNRLVLFDPHIFHAPTPGFGQSRLDGKLTQQFQFNEDS